MIIVEDILYCGDTISTVEGVQYWGDIISNYRGDKTHRANGIPQQ